MDLIPAIPAHAVPRSDCAALLAQHHYCIITDVLRPPLVARVRAAARDAFALPKPQRMAYRAAMNGSGYLPPGSEGVATYAPTFTRHAWDFRGPHWRHRFPREVPALAPAAGALARVCARIGTRIATRIGTTLPTEPHILRDGVARGRHFLRVLHYPAQQDAAPELRFPAHRDFGLLTMLVGGAETGFELETPCGWIGIHMAPTDVLVLGGTMLQLVSGGHITAARHRIAAIAHERIAMICFIEPRPDALLPNGETATAYLNRLVRRIRHA